MGRTRWFLTAKTNLRRISLDGFPCESSFTKPRGEQDAAQTWDKDMKSVSGAQAFFRTSAAVLTMVLLGHAAMAQDAETEEPVVEDVVEYIDEGGEYIDEGIEYIDEGGEYIDEPVEYVEDWVAEEGELPTDEEFLYDGEVILSDGIGDGVPLDDDVLYGEGEEIPSDDGATGEEPVFVTSCGGCELEFVAGGPEVQRDDGPAAVIGNRSSDNDPVVARSGGNACDSGPLSKMWICTVQNGSWRD
jgi:hypothetical protein